MTSYEWGRTAALNELGIKEASLTTILVRQRKDPYTEIYRRLNRAFRIKMPKFDMNAQLKRMLQNPFKQPTAMLAGKMRPLRI